MYRAIGFDKRNENYPQLTDHYFTGEYPVKPIDELGDNKITQLSLLNNLKLMKTVKFTQMKMGLKEYLF